MANPLSDAVANTATSLRGRVFLSYGHDEACHELAARIRADLQAQGSEPWIDEQEIRLGDDCRQRITAGILQSQHMLAFLSQHSMSQPGVCRQERAIALISQRQWPDMQQWRAVKAVDCKAFT